MAGSTHFMEMNPAFFASRARRWAFAALALLAAASFLASWGEAQRRGGSSPLDTLGQEVSQADGLEILKTFRSLGIVGEYRLRFQLRIMPKGEKTRNVSGLLLGTHTRFGPLMRVDVALEESSIGDSGELIPAKVKRLLLQNGIFANALEANGWEEDAVGTLIESEDYFVPIAGSHFTAFDLLMPFSFWQSFEYEGRTKLRGRPVHVFTMLPPEEDAKLREQVSKARIFLDEEFNALIQVEVYNAEERHAKTISVIAFKTVDGQAVPSQVDTRDELTRGKTRFRVLDAAVGVEAPDWVFEPDGLDRDIYGTELASLQSTSSAAQEDE